jgi:hypothetical protein
MSVLRVTGVLSYLGPSRTAVLDMVPERIEAFATRLNPTAWGAP